MSSLTQSLPSSVRLLLSLRHCAHRLNEACLPDPVVVARVQVLAHAQQVLLVYLEPTVAADPPGERVQRYVAHAVLVHGLEDALAVQLQLIALQRQLFACLHHAHDQLVKRAHPGLSIQVLLLEAELGGVAATDMAVGRVAGGDSASEFLVVNGVVTIGIHGLADLVAKLNVGKQLRGGECVGKLLSINASILVSVKKTKCFTHVEGLMTEKHLTEAFQTALLVDHVLDVPEQHRVLNLLHFLISFLLSEFGFVVKLAFLLLLFHLHFPGFAGSFLVNETLLHELLVLSLSGLALELQSLHLFFALFLSLVPFSLSALLLYLELLLPLRSRLFKYLFAFSCLGLLLSFFVVDLLLEVLARLVPLFRLLRGHADFLLTLSHLLLSLLQFGGVGFAQVEFLCR